MYTYKARNGSRWRSPVRSTWSSRLFHNGRGAAYNRFAPVFPPATSMSYFHVTSMCSLASALGEIESVYVTVARNGKRETSRWRNKDPGKHGDRGCRERERRDRERETWTRRVERGWEEERRERRRSSSLIGVELRRRRRRRRLLPWDKIRAGVLFNSPDPLLRDRLRGSVNGIFNSTIRVSWARKSHFDLRQDGTLVSKICSRIELTSWFAFRSSIGTEYLGRDVPTR